MIIGIIGSGGREHAICAKLLESKKVDKVYCFPGNAGTNLIATNVEIKANEFKKIKEFVINNKIDFLVVGPEKPLVDGIVNYFQKNNIKVFGPEKVASQLEGSKIFTKKLCKKYNIPTAKFGIFEKIKEANLFLKNSKFPIVVKADSLAAGKGVYICEDIKEAKYAVNEIFNGKFGIAKNVLIEEFLSGEEMSYFIISDGKNYKKFQTAQDHKRVLEGDKGKNTGGMGAYSPSRLINEDLDKKIIKKIIEPTINGLKEMNTKFIGFLYAGLMIVENEPYLIEYNVRMGDPETEAVFPRIKSDVLELFLALGTEKFALLNLEIDHRFTSTVMLVSGGYPLAYQKYFPIIGLNDANESLVFHAGTKNENNSTVTNGGRVLAITSFGETLKKATENCYREIKKISFKEMYYRKDIGFDL